MIFFRLRGLTMPSESAHRDEDEILEPHVFSVPEARALVAGGEIRDMKTVVGLTYCTVP